MMPVLLFFGGLGAVVAAGPIRRKLAARRLQRLSKKAPGAAVPKEVPKAAPKRQKPSPRPKAASSPPKASPQKAEPPRDVVGAITLCEKDPATGKESCERVDNLPNLATIAGYALGTWWCFGGPHWAALASIGLDEADGYLARSRGEETKFGAELDFTADMVLSGLALERVGAPSWTVPAATIGSIAFRKRFGRPKFGSLRALIMLYGIAKETKETST